MENSIIAIRKTISILWCPTIFLVVILSNDLDRQYDIIMDENCIEACLESLENGISRLMKSGSGSNFSFSDDEKKENMKQFIIFNPSWHHSDLWPHTWPASMTFHWIKHHFMKFETIAMQAISLLFHDTRSANWSKQLSKRVINHCLRNVSFTFRLPFYT